MSSGFGAQGHLEVDADAVCAQCATVNPEGTLICKTCGNNLRDQRTLRLVAEQALEGVDLGEKRRVMLSGLLSFMGILLVLLTVLNLGSIQTWLIDMQNTEAATVRGLWNGEDSAVFGALLANLDAMQLNGGALENARTNPAQNPDATGVYAIFVGETVVAVANVEQQGEELFFVGRVLDSDTEYRGRAQAQGSAFAVFEGNSGVMMDGEVFGIVGIARLMDDAGYECYGQSLQSERSFQFVGYPVALQ
ncbi:MAG: hypothetical protein HYV27_08810 [Candidatus Hydrogenedentes bacterium]|nr:hypothetical protein [Candidatus Hydrogenedentota bacterium]